MDRLRKLSLQKEIDEEAKRIEKRVSENPELKDIQVSDEFDAAMLKKIQEYEEKKAKRAEANSVHPEETEFAEELMPDIELLSNNKNAANKSMADKSIYNERTVSEKDKGLSGTVTVHRRKKKKYAILALAAVLILVLGSGLTSIGSKSYWKVLWERIVGDEKAAVINVEDMEIQETKDNEEIDVYKDIGKEFGISVVRLYYKPKGMILENYDIDIEQKRAQLFYNFNNQIIRYSIYLNDSDSSFGQKELDKLTDEYTLIVDGTDIKVEEYKKENSYRYIAEFKYKEVYYQLKGVMERSEFEKIIKNLRFL